MDKMKMGRYLFGREESEDLNIGVILAHFQSEGNEPDAMERLKSLVRLGVIDTAVCLSIYHQGRLIR